VVEKENFPEGSGRIKKGKRRHQHTWKDELLGNTGNSGGGWITSQGTCFWYRIRRTRKVFLIEEHGSQR